MCAVSYATEGGEKMAFRKFFKFQVLVILLSLLQIAEARHMYYFSVEVDGINFHQVPGLAQNCDSGQTSQAPLALECLFCVPSTNLQIRGY